MLTAGSPKYELLQENDTNLYTQAAQHGKSSRRYHFGLHCLLAISLLGNLVFLFLWLSFRQSDGKQFLSRFAGLPMDEVRTYLVQTKFSDTNETLADEHWETMDSGSGGITLSDEYAIEHDLSIGDRLPWNENKGLYFIKGFHEMHCLKLIRKSLSEFHRDVPQTLTHGHVNHCVDTLRQSVMCEASDLPLPTIKGRSSAAGDGQVMQCRSWEKLTEWANSPERESCFRWIDEYNNPTHLYERFAFCPEGSEDYPAMMAYFDEKGHNDPFG